VSVFPISPYRDDGAAPLPEDEYVRAPGLPEARCPGQVMMVEPSGTAYACCASGSSNRFLAVGRIGAEPLERLETRLRRNVKFRLLRRSGPIHFAREAIRRGAGQRLRPSYAGPCDLCLHLATDPELARIAEQVCVEQELAELRRAWHLDEEMPVPAFESAADGDTPEND
jgi:hypothetical protein